MEMDIFQHGLITEEPLRGGVDVDVDDDRDRDGGDTDTDEPDVDDAQLWGYLQPCSLSLRRINLFKEILRYSFGRDDDNNLIALRSPTVSLLHCVLTWDPVSSAVTVLDTSSNGTWLDGRKVGRGNTVPLTDGTEIGFGTSLRQPADGGIRDFRYTFHSLTNTNTFHSLTPTPTLTNPPTSPLTPAPAPSSIRTYFHTVAQLGKGATGTVFLAGHITTGLPFAIKRILKTTSRGGMEVKAMRRIEHPNVCKLIQVFETGLEISLVLEFVNGGDLISYITDSYPSGIPELIAKDMVHQACNAMAFIHSKGIIHRDLKLENILLTRDTHPIVKIADFGTAAAVDDLALLRKQCGTPYYFAPEIITGASGEDEGEDEGCDDKVDSWSMGIVVYAMLTGCFPFQTVQVRNPSSLTEYIATRSVDWDLINTKRGLYIETLTFIYDLLRESPAARMSLADARRHPWLREHIPFHTNLAAVFSDTSTDLNANTNTNSKNTNTDVGVHTNTDAAGPGVLVNRPLTLFETMRRERARAMNAAGRAFVARCAAAAASGTQAGAGWYHERQVGNGMRMGMGGAPPPAAVGRGFGARTGSSADLGCSSGSGGSGSFVRRRRDVIDEAQEAGTPILEPSQEMIAYTLRRSRRLGGGGTGPGPGTGNGKGKGTGKGKERAVDGGLGLGESSSSSSSSTRDVQMGSPTKSKTMGTRGGQGQGQGQVGLRTSPRNSGRSGAGIVDSGTQGHVDADRQEGPSDWAGAMHMEEDSEEGDVEMGGVREDLATRPGAVTRARTRTLKERAVAARKVRFSSRSGQVGGGAGKGKAKAKKRV